MAWAPFGSWDAPGAGALGETVERHYVQHGLCDDRAIHLHRGLARPDQALDCE